MPEIIHETTRIHEIIDLILFRKSFRTYYAELAQGDFGNECRPSVYGIRLKQFIAIRAAMSLYSVSMNFIINPDQIAFKIPIKR